MPRRRTAEEIYKAEERERYRNLKLRAKASKGEIIAKHSIEPAALRAISPHPLPGHPADGWRLLLQLYKPGDVVWVGQTTDSCGDDQTNERKAACREHFRTVTEWLNKEAAPAQFTCPSVFKSGVHSRSNANVLFRRFLVVESDVLTKPKIGAVFMWARQFMRLRAVVDTAGKSLHGWFDAPSPEWEKELQIILPELCCDPALFKLSQPCRLPGARRGKEFQTLIYLDLKGER